VALGLVEEQEERLRAVLESSEATPDEKFAALVDLAHLAGILQHEMVEAEAAAPTGDVGPSASTD
jgi:hypothetical protein